ncbi:MAG: lysophospholipid acyltransferase family protein [Nitrospirota bacterium]
MAFKNGAYRTGKIKATLLARLSPSFYFYRQIIRIVFTASRKAKRSRYGDNDWIMSSLDTLRALESAGVSFEITGIDNFKDVEGPCVFIANHMSTLETFVLPVIIAPFKMATFVVKGSLVEYPVFKHVMRSREPITVSRTNPREDLKTVFEGGAERLRKGTSIIIFPQTTRSTFFDPAEFNTIGVKLAKKAEVPVVPVALKTDAWGNGRRLKDFGRIDPSLSVHFAFGKPLWIKDRGNEEHREIIGFITEKLKEWRP